VEHYADELKDFVEDANVEESDSDAESGVDESRKRKKKSDDEAELDDQLEDDDYDLLEENLGIKVQRVRILPSDK
jgi:transcription elongation factor SPT6